MTNANKLNVQACSIQGLAITFLVAVPFAVNMGVTRPAIIDISKVIIIMLAYALLVILMFAVPIMLRCMSEFTRVSASNIGTKIKLRYCLILIIGRPKTIATTGRKSRSMSMVKVWPNIVGKIKQMRAINQIKNNKPSCLPYKPRAPVQFCTAVSKNPTMIATANPKIIS